MTRRSSLQKISSISFKRRKGTLFFYSSSDPNRDPKEEDCVVTTQRNAVLQNGTFNRLKLKQRRRGSIESSVSVAPLDVLKPVNANADTMEDDKEEMSAPFIASPDGLVQAIWNTFMFIVSSFLLLFIPFSQSFGHWVYTSERTPILQDLSIAIDAVFLINIILRLNFFAVIVGNDVVTRQSEIRAYYIRSWDMLIDVLTFLPIKSLGMLTNLSVLRTVGDLTHCLRLLMFRKYSSGITMLTNKLPNAYAVGHPVKRMVKLVWFVMLVAYLMGCVYFSINYVVNEGWIGGADAGGKDDVHNGTSEEIVLSNWANPSLTQEDDQTSELGPRILLDRTSSANYLQLEPQHQFHHCNPFCLTETSAIWDFISAMYFSVQTLFTVGYGDIVPVTLGQIVFVNFLMILGAIAHAFVIANMSSLLKNLDITGARFRHKKSHLNAYMRNRRLKPQLRAKVVEYLDYSWVRQKGRKEESILRDLPPMLQNEVVSAKRSALYRIPLFRRRELAFLDTVVQLLQRLLLTAGDVLVREHDEALHMWILIEGKLQILRPSTFNATDGSMAFSSGYSSASTSSAPGAAPRIRKMPSREKSFMKTKILINGVEQAAYPLDEITPGQAGFIGENALFKRAHDFTIRAVVTSELQQLSAEALQLIIDRYVYVFKGRGTTYTGSGAQVNTDTSVDATDATDGTDGTHAGDTGDANDTSGEDNSDDDDDFSSHIEQGSVSNYKKTHKNKRGHTSFMQLGSDEPKLNLNLPKRSLLGTNLTLDNTTDSPRSCGGDSTCSSPGTAFRKSQPTMLAMKLTGSFRKLSNRVAPGTPASPLGDKPRVRHRLSSIVSYGEMEDVDEIRDPLASGAIIVVKPQVLQRELDVVISMNSLKVGQQGTNESFAGETISSKDRITSGLSVNDTGVPTTRAVDHKGNVVEIPAVPMLDNPEADMLVRATLQFNEERIAHWEKLAKQSAEGPNFTLKKNESTIMDGAQSLLHPLKWQVGDPEPNATRSDDLTDQQENACFFCMTVVASRLQRFIFARRLEQPFDMLVLALLMYGAVAAPLGLALAPLQERGISIGWAWWTDVKAVTLEAPFNFLILINMFFMPPKKSMEQAKRSKNGVIVLVSGDLISPGWSRQSLFVNCVEFLLIIVTILMAVSNQSHEWHLARLFLFLVQCTHIHSHFAKVLIYFPRINLSTMVTVALKVATIVVTVLHWATCCFVYLRYVQPILAAILVTADGTRFQFGDSGWAALSSTNLTQATDMPRTEAPSTNMTINMDETDNDDIYIASNLLGAASFGMLRDLVLNVGGNFSSTVDGVDRFLVHTNATMDIPDPYMASFYWALVTTATVGFGDIVPESLDQRLYTMLVIIVGATLYAGFISILAAITSYTEVHEEHSDHIANCMRYYLLNREMPKDLTNRCMGYLEYEDKERRGLDDTKVLDTMLPESLKRRVMDEIAGVPFVSRSALFQNESPVIIAAVTDALQHFVFCPRDLIVSPIGGKDGHCAGLKRGMIFLHKGEACVLTENKQPLRSLLEGDSFGGISLFVPELQKMRVQAVGFCEVWAIFKNDMDMLLERLGRDGSIVDSFGARQQLEKKARKVMVRFGGTGKPKAGKKSKNQEKIFGDVDTQALPKSKLSKYVCLPGSRFAKTWHSIAFIAVAYNLINLPFQAAFNVGTISEKAIWGFVFDYLADIVYIFDVYLRWTHLPPSAAVSNSADESPEKRAVSNTLTQRFTSRLGSIISRRLTTRAVTIENSMGPPTISMLTRPYRRSFSAALDIIASVPAATIVWLVVPQATYMLYILFRIPRLLRCRRIPFYIRTLQGLLPINGTVQRVAILIVAMLVSAHWAGCILFVIARADMASAFENGQVAVTWANNPKLPFDPLLTVLPDGTIMPHPSMLSAYSWGVYWAIAALTTVGYGDVVAISSNELIFSLTLLALGGFIYAMILSNLEEIVAQSDISSILFQRRTDSLNDYVKYRKLSRLISSRIANYQQVLWARQRGVEEAFIHDHLPLSLRRTIRGELLGQSSLNKVPFFKAWGEVDALVDMLQPITYLEDTILYLHGEYTPMLFMIARGKVEYVSGDGSQVYTSFLSGDIFGEIAFFLNEITPCAARVVEETDMMVLHRNRFDEYLARNPDIAKLFEVELAEKEEDMRKRYSLDGFTKNLNKAKVGKFFQHEGDSGSTAKHGELVFLPNSPFRRRWSLLLTFTIFYCYISVPYVAVFLEGYYPSMWLAEPWKLLDLVCDVVLVVNIVLNARYFTRIDDGMNLKTRAEIFRSYRHRWIYTDVLSVLPLDYIFAIVWPLSLSEVAALRVFRLLSGLRLLQLFGAVEDMLQESHIHVTSGYRKLTGMLIIGLLAIHVVACIRGFVNDVARPSRSFQSTFTADTFNSTQYDMGAVFHDYMHCQYWAFYTVTTVGFGSEVVQEPILAIFVMLFGTFLCDAGVTATVSNMISSEDSKTGNMRRKMESVLQYLHSNRINPVTVAKIQEFLTFRNKVQMDLQEDLLLQQSIPEYLKVEIMLNVAIGAVPRFANHPTFRGFSEGLIQSVAARLRPVVVTSNTDLLICEDDEVGSRMLSNSDSAVYGAAKRSMASRNSAATTDRETYLKLDDVLVYILVSGSVVVKVGEKLRVIRRGLIAKSSGVSSAKTVSTCEMFVLTMEDFVELNGHCKTIGGFFESVEHLLADIEAINVLETFAGHTLGSSGPVQFYRATIQFNQDLEHGSMAAHVDAAKRIYTSFLGPEADVGPRVSKLVADAIEIEIENKEVGADTFEAAIKEVLKVISTEIVPPFMVSKEFREVLHNSNSRARKQQKSKCPYSTDSNSATSLRKEKSLVVEEMEKSVGTRDSSLKKNVYAENEKVPAEQVEEEENPSIASPAATTPKDREKVENATNSNAGGDDDNKKVDVVEEA